MVLCKFHLFQNVETRAKSLQLSVEDKSHCVTLTRIVVNSRLPSVSRMALDKLRLYTHRGDLTTRTRDRLQRFF